MGWFEVLLILLFIVGPTLVGVLRGEGKPEVASETTPKPPSSGVYVLKPEGKEILYQALGEFLDRRGVDRLLGKYLPAGGRLNGQEFQHVKGLVASKLGAERAEMVMNAAFTRVEAGAQPSSTAPVSTPPAPSRPMLSAASSRTAYVVTPGGKEIISRALEQFLSPEASQTVISRNISPGGGVDRQSYQNLEALLAQNLGSEEARAILRSALATQGPLVSSLTTTAASQMVQPANQLLSSSLRLAATLPVRDSSALISSSLSPARTSITSPSTPVVPVATQVKPLLDLTSPRAVLNGIIWHEILGEPRARQINSLRRAPRKKV